MAAHAPFIDYSGVDAAFITRSLPILARLSSAVRLNFAIPIALCKLALSSLRRSTLKGDDAGDISGEVIGNGILTRVKLGRI